MKTKKESFRWRIYIYNIMLLTMVAIMGTMYFLLNEDTIDTYNDTFTTYNELNHFYVRVKDMNTTYLEYLENGDEALLKEVYKEKDTASTTLHRVERNLVNKSRLPSFEELHAHIDAYEQLAVSKNTGLSIEKLKDQTHEQYLVIMKTRGSYYELITEDMQDYKEIVNQNRTKLGWMSVLLVSFMLIWIVYFSTTMIRSITNPIETIIHNINLIKRGEYDLTQLSNINQEMNVLCLALEDMAENVQKNISYAKEKAELEKKVLEQENENLKKDELLAQGELRILQNQINPHFLFNTLNMIYKKAYSEGAYETSELMEKTSQLLRYSLDNSNKISSLYDELKAVENYMFIQEKRFGERICFQLDVQPELTNIKMPTMILQPLVENAVQHGLRDTMENGEVIVNAYQEGEETILSVNDNGKGMSSSKLEELILNDYHMKDHVREHIGLYNVTRRLHMFYGDKVAIIINSEEECGFEFVIRIQGR